MPFCKDCKHYKEADLGPSTAKMCYCPQLSSMDYREGELIPAHPSHARKSEQYYVGGVGNVPSCGPSGNYFEPKPEEPPASLPIIAFAAFLLGCAAGGILLPLLGLPLWQ